MSSVTSPASFYALVARNGSAFLFGLLLSLDAMKTEKIKAKFINHMNKNGLVRGNHDLA
jgi:hypothetical protein